MFWRLLALVLSVGIVVSCAISGCGDKYTLPTDLPKPDYSHGIDTTYVQVNPVWTSAAGVTFNHPNDVYIGYDQYIYICDTGNDRVVKLDVDGAFLDSFSVVHPVAITQDRGLDLLVVAGDFIGVTQINDTVADTLVYGNAVYRKRHFGAEGFKPVFRDESGYQIAVHGGEVTVPIEYWGIAASLEIDKQYFIADFGRNRIFRVGPDDIPILENDGLPLIEEGDGIGQTRYPIDLFAYELAGQNYLAYTGTSACGVQVVNPTSGRPIFGDSTGLPQLVRFKGRPKKDIAVDELSNFYVLMEEPDPILGSFYNNYFYKFDRYGALILSFGAFGSGERQFKKPQGIAYKSGVIYIADTGNNRIVRYELSTGYRP